MKYKVFHAKNLSNAHFASAVECMLDAVDGKYYLAGEIEANDLEYVFHCTQNLESGWKDGQRSTSVGDLIQDPTGVVHKVAGLGFEAIGLSFTPNLTLYCPESSMEEIMLEQQ